MSSNLYDCIIVGAGPAGLAAALYSARDKFNTVMLEKFYPGGQIVNTDKIENYPGMIFCRLRNTDAGKGSGRFS